MIDRLDREDRLRLMRFVCSFAWADLHVDETERDLVRRMVKQLQLDEEDTKQVEGWLDVPPRAEDVDPNAVPRQHRQLFLAAVREMITADGMLHPDEVESFRLFRELLGDGETT